MNIKKRILSAAILLSVLGIGVGVTYTSNSGKNLKSVAIEDNMEDEDNSLQDFIEENEKEANPVDVYNEALSGTGVVLTESDIEYISSLRSKQSVVALNSTIGHYNIVDLSSDAETYVVMQEGERLRVADKALLEGDYYYDILTGMYCSEGMYGVTDEETMNIGEFVSTYNLMPEGFCLPNIDRCKASDEALETIEEVYGKEVSAVIGEKGLPLPYYDYEAIYNSVNYEKGAIKELTASE